VNGTDSERGSLVSAALHAIGGDRDDLLFAGGSTVEGLANPNSDIDLYVIGDIEITGTETAARKHEKTATIEYRDSREVNLTVLDPGGIIELDAAFRRSLASLSGEQGIEQLVDEDDLKVLHRIRTGRALQRPDRLDALRTDLGTDQLARYLLNMHAIAAVNRLTDVAGERADGHEESAAWMFREALVRVGQLVLAVDGETNSSSKWLVRLLLRGGASAAVRERVAQLLLGSTVDLTTDVGELKAHLATLVDASGTEAGPYLRCVARPKLG